MFLWSNLKPKIISGNQANDTAMSSFITNLDLGAPNELFCKKSCSTRGILLGKLIHSYVLLARSNTSAGRLFENIFVKWSLSPPSGENFVSEP